MVPELNDLKFIDLFAGIGGMRLAFESKGATCVFSSEWDKYAQKTYEANFGEIPEGDITKIRAIDIPKFDILLAGFPCQPFSSIGKREGFKHKTQGTLFYDVARIIDQHKPSAFLLENVSGLLTHDDGRTFSTIISTLIELGYEVEYKILDASDYGVPQKRERIYIVGFNKRKVRPGAFLFPPQRKKKVGIGKFVEKDRTDLSISKHLQSVYIYKLDDGRPEVITTKSEFPVKTLVASYHKIQRLTGTFVADGPTGLRLLSENECKAVMGYPKSFKIPVSRTQMYRQFGNSVAVPVIKAVADAMIKHLDEYARRSRK
ncbi:DNA cytosine methyltransferase [Actinobacteria bacterium IMCC26103]|nr:DNA cytosine methyltransferase [Actinobacteria bacterium IMCC26103]